MALLLASPAGRALAAANAVLVLAVLAGLAILWPGDSAAGRAPTSLAGGVQAEVTGVERGGCEAYAGPGCRVVAVRIREGRDAGRRSFVTFPSARFAPEVAAGDVLRVTRSTAPEADLARPETQPYAFADFERRTPLLLLALLFGVLVVVLARWQGLRALLGLAVSLALVVGFVAPAILDGRPPLLVAVVGALAVAAVTMALTHGLGIKSQAALLASAGSLALIALLGTAAVEAAHITGLSEETTLLLEARSGQSLNLQGLVLAGLVIGALGVLDDVTISQASTVLALRRVDEGLGFRRLFGEAISVGRDHLGATVNTLVLAYAGAALPALLIFSFQGVGPGTAVGFESVATEVVAMLAGSIGLIAAVPLTTALAAALAVRLPASAVPDVDGHAHVH